METPPPRGSEAVDRTLTPQELVDMLAVVVSPHTVAPSVEDLAGVDDSDLLAIEHWAKATLLQHRERPEAPDVLAFLLGARALEESESGMATLSGLLRERTSELAKARSREHVLLRERTTWMDHADKQRLDLRGVLCIRDVRDRDTDELMGLPEPLSIERVEVGGLFALVRGTFWCRPDAPAHAGSPVPWDTTVNSPWVVELHVMVPCRDGGEDVPVIFACPCTVDPRVPGVEANLAIMTCMARAALHEALESVTIDGKRADPHEHGEPALESVRSALLASVLFVWGFGAGPRGSRATTRTKAQAELEQAQAELLHTQAELLHTQAELLGFRTPGQADARNELLHLRAALAAAETESGRLSLELKQTWDEMARHLGGPVENVEDVRTALADAKSALSLLEVSDSLGSTGPGTLGQAIRCRVPSLLDMQAIEAVLDERRPGWAGHPGQVVTAIKVMLEGACEVTNIVFGEHRCQVTGVGPIRINAVDHTRIVDALRGGRDAEQTAAKMSVALNRIYRAVKDPEAWVKATGRPVAPGGLPQDVTSSDVLVEVNVVLHHLVDLATNGAANA